MADRRRSYRSSPRRKSRRHGKLRRFFALAAIAAIALGWVGCQGSGHGALQRVHIPEGASFSTVTDSLATHHIVRAPLLFRLYARLTGASRRVRPGTYGFRAATGWDRVLRDLAEGRVLTAKLIVPEGFRLVQIAPRVARITGLDGDSVLRVLQNPATTHRFHVPGPTMEGYLYPATYTWAIDVPLDTVVAGMVRRYRQAWTHELHALADSVGMSERAAVTLASIIQAEAKISSEMPTISAVYHNRLRIGMPLQADPTVQYALAHRRDRLLYADIDSVASSPYNTYTHRGLPPGPIGSPSQQAMEAALRPAAVNYLYFVARPDGTDIFSRSLAEHNRAKAQVRALIAAESAAAARTGTGASPVQSVGSTPPTRARSRN